MTKKSLRYAEAIPQAERERSETAGGGTVRGTAPVIFERHGRKAL